MKKEFLQELGIDKDVIDKILEENSKDVEKYKSQAENSKNDNTTLQSQIKDMEQKLTELQKSTGNAEELKKQLETVQQDYEKEKQAFQKQIAERDYSDAMKNAIEKCGIKFTSEIAKKTYFFITNLFYNKWGFSSMWRYRLKCRGTIYPSSG